MDAPVKTVSTESLRNLVAEMEDKLEELRGELERREQNEQEREIANLENHLKSAEFSVRTISDFISYLLKDIRSGRSG